VSKVKFTVITKGEWTAGFRLAGVDVLEAQDEKEARQILQPMLEKSEPTLIAIEEDLFPIDDKKIQKHLEEKPFPVILPLPKIQVQTKEEQEKYVSELVRSCIGYYVKLK
jgi:vacuolar-type H+-ATPase subunit F/Vma7